MGTFVTTVSVRRDKSGPFKDVTALVHTGATYSMLPADLLHELGVSPIEENEFTLADGRRQALPVGEMLFRIGVNGGNGRPASEVRERTSLVIFGPPDRYLLGAVTLQSFGLIADTTHHELIPAPELTL